MEIREKVLLENSAFIAAIYMDPRFRNTVSPVDKARAKIHIFKTWKQIRHLKSNDLPIPLPAPVSSNELEDDIDLLIKEREHSEHDSYSEEIDKDATIALALNEYEKEPRLKKEDDVLKFWYSKKDCYPQLFQISQVLLSVPVIQVSVERTFSGVKFLLNPQRSRIDDGILDDILVIRCNAQFGDKYVERKN